MATLTKAISKNLFDSILPTFGSPRVHVPAWDNGIELYAFNGKRVELIQKRDYDKVHRNEAFVRMESEAMVKDFLAGILKAQRTSVPADQLESQAKELIDGCYKSFLDSDFNTRLTQILPAIEQR